MHGTRKHKIPVILASLMIPEFSRQIFEKP